MEYLIGCASGWHRFSPSTPLHFRCHLILASPHHQQGLARKQSARVWFQCRTKLFRSFILPKDFLLILNSFLSPPQVKPHGHDTMAYNPEPWMGCWSSQAAHSRGGHGCTQHTKHGLCKDRTVSFVIKMGTNQADFKARKSDRNKNKKQSIIYFKMLILKEEMRIVLPILLKLF